MADQTTFSDIDLNFGIHPVTGDIVPTTNETAVKRSIRNIINTIPGEKPFLFTFGTPIQNLLFDFEDFTNEIILKTTIEHSINKFEPRVELVGIEVEANPDSQAYSISIFFKLKNKESVYGMDILLKKLR